jgi:hypothetical protein
MTTENKRIEKNDVLVARGGVKDYSPATNFGEIKEVKFTSRDMRNISRHLADSVDVLKKYKQPPYILLSGNLSLVMSLVLSCYELFGTVRALVYDVKRNCYHERITTKSSIINFLINSNVR